MLKITSFKTEYQTNPIGLDVEKPRFSWVLESKNQSTQQTGYNLSVSDDVGMVWTSGDAQSEISVLVTYGGPPLKPQRKYKVALTIKDNHGMTASTIGWFETGLLSNSHIQGKWITHGYEDKVEPCPVYTRTFNTNGKIKKARIYASALGVYQIELNGKKIGDAFLAPGWTSYKTRVQYQTYDITHLLHENNQIEITSANGWFSGEFGFTMEANHYGKRNAVWAQIEITYEDGSREMICTDESWRYGTGPRRYSEIYHGEVIDHNYSVVTEGNAVLLDYSMTVLRAQESEPVRITRRMEATRCITTPKGETVYDFGQNLTGIIELRVTLPKDTKLTLQHAEVLDKEGNFYTDNLRGARATDIFICKGEGEEVFLPAFTFHGFRYVKLEGAKLELNALTACVLHTDMEPTGEFSCSHEGVNRLWKNIQWGQRGNFLDVPTDCPQRDERLGWTGDAQMFAATAAYNFNVALFFTKWLRDLYAEQSIEMGVPHVVPNILGNFEGAAAWSDAATIIPWTLYEAYGDTRLIAEQYESMKLWVEYIRTKAGEKHLWQTGHQYGDWVASDREEISEGRTGSTDVYLIATAYYAYSTHLLVKTAKLLGKKEDETEYTQLYEDIVNAFQQEYITATGRLVSETQTGCLMALHFNLAKPEHRERILNSLISNLNKHNNHLTTGFVGTPYLCHVLSENGQHDLAGTVFLKRDYPSWLYCVDQGATTIWERWNSMKPDGSFDESGMNSFNHYAYGSVGSWMAQKLGGLNLVEAGYKKSRIEPMPIKGITQATASIKTVYGLLSCSWECKSGIFTADISVPCNTTAIIALPGKEEVHVGSGNYHYEYETDLKLAYERYSMESTLRELFENPISLGILKQYSPEITDNPMIEFALGQSIAQLLPMMPEGGAALFDMAIQAANNADNNEGAEIRR